ncbi:hypothetical protein CWC18_15770 [Pseudoalteromonas aurantia]|uniref:Uncharacterized protein n=2 Tax=Pseudoalteromonas aurantia TaxID=43654 RepID=A0A5S3V610_9GAMM|nr:hypothetical protein CWC18_15770 [Pseudoalteromonas aurantia]TMO66426.1 hypothetical protein CWC19_16315 [Pseudoalteromonas aurantia]TMO70318.1 hypothetical protein CWC20_19790 [Pseudoalteromonas aurantia]
MNIITKHIKWIMVMAGLLTCSMVFAVFSPQATLIRVFGEALTQPLAQIVVRSWGFLIFLMGILLIYGAYIPVYRKLALTVVSTSKIVFITLIVIFGEQYIDKSMLTIILDSTLVFIFICYLIKVKNVT